MANKNYERICEVDIVIDTTKYTFTYNKPQGHLHSINFDISVLGIAQPQSSSVILKNLSHDFYKKVQSSIEKFVFVKAGYYDRGLQTIGSGLITVANVVSQLPDSSITLIFTPGSIPDVPMKFYNKGETIKSIISDLIGNADYILEIDNDIANIKTTSKFSHNGSIIGSIDRLSRSYSFDICYEKDKIKIFPPDKKGSNTKVFRLSETNGLLNTPAIRQDGGLDVSMFLYPNVEIGDIVEVDLKRDLFYSTDKRTPPMIFDMFQQKGQQYQVFSIKHQGDTYGNNWYTLLETKRLG